MEAIRVPSIDVSIVESENKSVVLLTAEADRLIVKTGDDYLAAGDLRSRLKGKIKRLEEIRKGITVPLDNAKKAVMALFGPPTDALSNAVSKVDVLAIAYDNEQQRKAREAQARADEIARREREKAEARARELEAQGKTEKAAAYQEKANAIIAPVIEAATPKVAGQAIKTMWYAEVVDFTALSDEYKIPNQTALDKIAQATQGNINLSGVVFKSRKIVAGRSL